ncbi:MAG TPA: type II secretion system protein [Candidatus Nanoperiomorbaceae bacterium]|nr:type II secretion system protein [Candidatus Nanoperiomorbaceae bacterium]HMU11727.1 type II secretion system protein [Candidatus Nanoperiomorbaceae bacterium]
MHTRRVNGRNESGFTIIEVVLVLAIAGLIFLTVFLALPALQKSQRDNARRQDVGRVVAGVQQYLTDNGSTPATGAQLSGYTGNLEQLSILVESNMASCLALGPYPQYAYVSRGCKCSDAGAGATPVTGARYANVQTRLENGGRYCKDV